MLDYRIRRATLEDADILVRHRVAMFEDMGLTFDHATLGRAFRHWLQAVMPSDQYLAWLAESADGELVAGGGITVIPWPPGPRSLKETLAYVYNVYTEPLHRKRGVARLVMDAIHAWCRVQGVGSMALNASRSGQPLYETLGYAVTPSPMMFLSLD